MTMTGLSHRRAIQGGTQTKEKRKKRRGLAPDTKLVCKIELQAQGKQQQTHGAFNASAFPGGPTIGMDCLWR